MLVAGKLVVRDYALVADSKSRSWSADWAEKWFGYQCIDMQPGSSGVAKTMASGDALLSARQVQGHSHAPEW